MGNTNVSVGAHLSVDGCPVRTPVRLAWRHAGMLRGLALALGFVLPLGALVYGVTRWQSILAVAACCIIGLLVERWLLFAEAKHTVRLFHGDLRT